MQFGYVVLYVEDHESSLEFWTATIGMVQKSAKQAGDYQIVQVGFENQDFTLELVPLALMRQFEHGLDLATPSMAFRVSDLDATRDELIQKGVTVSDINEQAGVLSFAFSDTENHWFAVLRS